MRKAVGIYTFDLLLFYVLSRERERENNNRSHMKEAVILKHTKMFIKILSVDKKYLTTSIFRSNNIFICIHQNLKSSGLIRRHVIPSLSDFKTKNRDTCFFHTSKIWSWKKDILATNIRKEDWEKRCFNIWKIQLW